MIPLFPLKPPYTPELLPRVQRYLEYLLLDWDASFNVLELGSGYSTVWFSRLGGLVVSLEHNKEWAEAVQELCPYAKVIRRNPQDFVGTIQALNAVVNVLYVDCVDEQRLPGLKAALPKLAKDAIIILDDSHWDMLAPARELLKELPQVTFSGLHTRKTGEVKFHQTTIYFKGEGL